MDPNETLRVIREMSTELIRQGCHAPDETEELIQHFRDLDEWLSKGGHLPADWWPYLMPRKTTPQ